MVAHSHAEQLKCFSMSAIGRDLERDCFMPHCEFICHDCHKGFLKTLTRHDYEEGEVTCPHCGSDRVELRVTLPDAATKKSA
jgi:putative FmdB family regulatory protein